MPTLAPSSKRAVKDRMKAPEEPDVTITREGSISKLYQRPYKSRFFFLILVILVQLYIQEGCF